MSRFDLYVIEARNEDGSLNFDRDKLRVDEVFGRKAITGITEDRIAEVVWRHEPDAVLDGRSLLRWATKVDPRFQTRKKYW